MSSITDIARPLIVKILKTKLYFLRLYFLSISSVDWLIARFYQGVPFSDAMLIIKLDAIGDFILWLDSAKEFRKLYPDKKLVLCANAIWSDLAECFPYWDEVIAVERNRLCTDLFYRIKLLTFIRKQRFKVAIQPTFSREYFTGDSLIRSSGAEQRIGSQGDLSNIIDEDKAISDTWYTKLIPADVAPLMEIKRNAEFIRGLGLENFSGGISKVEKLLDLHCELTPEKSYYVVFPGSLWKYKVWPASKFAELIIRNSKIFGLHVVLCGSLEEKSICDKIVELSGCVPIINLAGKTSLVELFEVIRRAKMLVGNDSSAIHIAAATGTPSVCILGGGHFGRFMPYEIEKKVSAPLPTPVFEKMDCYGCGWRCIYHIKRNQPFPCIDRITVDQVVHACIQVTSVISENISMKVYILLPVHNRCDLTRRFIDCLKLQTYQNFHLVLIDDGSTDGTSEMVSSNLDNVTIIRGNGTWWWAGALQQGYEWIIGNNISQSDIVLIINDDTEFEVNFLENAISVLSNTSKALLLARSFDIVTKELYEIGVHVDWRKLTFDGAFSEEEINCFSTRGLFMKVEYLRAMGGFYPKILPHYLSDYEFTMRAKRKGMKLITDESVRLFFNIEATGINLREVRTINDFIRNYLSIRSTKYIVGWTSFVLLASPIIYIPINIFRIWMWALIVLIKVLIGSIRLRTCM